jgi:hypothetical protein
MNNYEKWQEFYKRYPDKFVENFHPDIKLYSYQKMMLRIMCEIDKVTRYLPWGCRRFR